MTNINSMFEENYNLAFTQQRKNKDIPEGGSKGVILLNLAHQVRPCETRQLVPPTPSSPCIHRSCRASASAVVTFAVFGSLLVGVLTFHTSSVRGFVKSRQTALVAECDKTLSVC